MIRFPETLIPRRRQELEEVGKQVGPHLSPEKRQEAIAEARDKARRAEEANDPTGFLEWNAVADGLEG